MAERVTSPLAAEAPAEPLRIWLAIFFGYLGLALLFTWPLVFDLAGSVIQRGGASVDTGQGIWNLWWTRESLRVGQNPFASDYVYYPYGVDLFYQTISVPNGLLVLPINLLFGPIAAFNAVVLLSFALGGTFCYWLARSLQVERLAALAAGLVFAFGPYHIQRMWGGSMELIAIQWIPLYGVLLMRALHRRTLGSSLLAGAALLLTTLASQYYGLYCAVYSLAHVGLAALLAPGRRAQIATIAVGAGAAGVWLSGLLPFVWQALGEATIADWYERQVFHSVALVDFVMPHALHPLWGALAEDWQNRWHPFGLETGAAFGVAVYALVGVALWYERRRSWPWLGLALLMGLFAMGPVLHFTNQATSIPLPFALLNLAGPFRNSSRPSVFLAQMLIPLALLVALGLNALLRQPNRKWLAGLAVGGLLFESLVMPWQLVRLQVHSAYVNLASDPTPGVVVELPPRNNVSQSLLNQLCHGRPQVGGYLARLPDYPPGRANSGELAGLLNSRPLSEDIFVRDPAGELAGLGVVYVAIDLTTTPRSQAGVWRQRLAAENIEVLFSDDRLELYRIDANAARTHLLLLNGWYAAESDGERRWRWTNGAGEILLVAPQAGPARLSFRVTTLEGVDRPFRLWHGEKLLYEGSAPAAPLDRPIVLNFWARAGLSELRLESESERVLDGRTLGLSVSELQLASLPLVEGFEMARDTPPAPLPHPVEGLCQ